jgi:hypothetical protein
MAATPEGQRNFIFLLGLANGHRVAQGQVGASNIFFLIFICHFLIIFLSYVVVKA